MIKGENQNLKQKILSNMTAPTCFQIDRNLCKSKELKKLLFVAQMTNQGRRYWVGRVGICPPKFLRSISKVTNKT